MNVSFRTAAPEMLELALRDARNRTLKLFDRFSAAGLDRPAGVPLLPIVNPPLWELAHIAWFAEWYILRKARSSAPQAAERPSILPESDSWFNSNTIAHDLRWQLDMPPPARLKDYCGAVLDGVLAALRETPHADRALYPYRLVLAHEDMHGEAFAYTLQTLGVAPPEGLVTAPLPPPPTDQIEIAGGAVTLGSHAESGFVFDNEKWAHSCELPPFRIDAALVSNASYCDFIAAGGYHERRFWTEEGWQWLSQQGRSAPIGWTHADGRWHCLRFGERVVLPDDEPVRHVSLHEAQAFCNWAGRRLPNEAEWVRAASARDEAFQWGDLWEWTDSVFLPFDGFVADAYREYSQPYFGSHQVVRGASFATPSRFRSPLFRNFYAPHRSDFFVGFRTCALTT